MGTPQEQQNRAEEYWNIMPEMSRLSRHYKAAKVLETFDNDNEILIWRPIRDLIINDDELEILKNKYSRLERHKLLKKWSFSGLSQYFAKHKNDKYKNMGVLGYDYGIKSHLIHQDGDGVGIKWNRFRRNEERHDAVEISHAGKIISDICNLGLFRTGELMIACNQDPSITIKIYDKYCDLFEDIAQKSQSWYDLEYGHYS
jgi:hypothetical protein